MNWKALKDGGCPNCGNYIFEDPLIKNMIRCRARVTGCRFSISKTKFEELTSREAVGYRPRRAFDEVEDNQSKLNNL